jgi:hypothetical protein
MLLDTKRGRDGPRGVEFLHVALPVANAQRIQRKPIAFCDSGGRG